MAPSLRSGWHATIDPCPASPALDLLLTHMSLLKVDGRWQIVNKIFSRETRREHVSGS